MAKSYKSIDAMKIGQIDTIRDLLHEAFDRGYNNGHEDGLKEAWLDEFLCGVREKGRDEAWECARKIGEDYSSDRLLEIFGTEKGLFEYSASEAIQRIEEYEKQQKCKVCNYPLMNPLCGVGNETCDRKPKQTDKEIKVGNLVYSAVLELMREAENDDK